MKYLQILIGVVALGTIVASEVLEWRLSAGTVAALGGLVGWVVPYPGTRRRKLPERYVPPEGDTDVEMRLGGVR